MRSHDLQARDVAGETLEQASLWISGEVFESSGKGEVSIKRIESWEDRI